MSFVLSQTPEEAGKVIFTFWSGIAISAGKPVEIPFSTVCNRLIDEKLRNNSQKFGADQLAKLFLDTEEAKKFTHRSTECNCRVKIDIGGGWLIIRLENQDKKMIFPFLQGAKGFSPCRFLQDAVDRMLNFSFPAENPLWKCGREPDSPNKEHWPWPIFNSAHPAFLEIAGMLTPAKTNPVSILLDSPQPVKGVAHQITKNLVDIGWEILTARR